MITTLTAGLLYLAAHVDAGWAANQAPPGSLSSERKGTMLNAEQTQGQTGRVPHENVLPRAKTETATFALG